MDKPRRPYGRRKGSHACDSCRRSRRKCNRSARMQNAKSLLDSIIDESELDVPCWSCMKSGTKCTYGEYTQAKSHPKAYIERLEKRVNDLGHLLQRFSLSPDLRREVDSLLNAEKLQINRRPSSPHHLLKLGYMSSPSEQSHRTTRSTNDLIPGNIAGDNNKPHAERFLSNERFNDESNVLKRTPGFNGSVSNGPTVPFPKGWSTRSSAPGMYQPAIGDTSGPSIEAPLLLFPSKDLLMTLVDLYFTHSNIVWPLLHENSFKSDVVNESYLRCQDLGHVVLAVCAVASRYCKDRRVLAKVPRQPLRTGSRGSSHSWDLCASWLDDLDETSGLEASNYEDAPLCSAGWKYYSRIKEDHVNVMAPVKLTELQTVFLMQQFLFGMPDFTAGWVAVGAAIRRAQDLGVHRGEMYGTLNLETELWKRAFWCLVVVDRLGSARVGRSSCIKHEDMDIGLLVEIDDEYWSGPDKNGICVPLQQPPGKPSIMAAFNSLINLSCVYSWAQRTLFVLDKHKIGRSVPGRGTAQEIVDRLNEDLDEWVESVPLHLKGNPLQQNDVWRTQSADLYITYHILQMQIYQSFLPAPKFSPLAHGFGSQAYQFFRVEKSLPFPALAVCAYASRSIAQILKELLSHVSLDDDAFVELRDVPTLLIGAFAPAITLLIVKTAERHVKSWGNFLKKSNIHEHDLIAQENGDEILEVFMETLRRTQERWSRSARGLEIIRSAISLLQKTSSNETPGRTKIQRPKNPDSESVSAEPSQLIFSWPQSGGTATAPAFNYCPSSSTIQPRSNSESWTSPADRTLTGPLQLRHTPQFQIQSNYYAQDPCENYPEETANFQASTSHESCLTPRHPTHLPHCSQPPSYIQNTMGPRDPNIPRPVLTSSSNDAPRFDCFPAQAPSTVEGRDDSQPQTSSGFYDQEEPFWF